MNFPIPVNLTVAQNNVPVKITVSDNSESIGLDVETQIVASVASEYEGPYSVTPSASEQTLSTDGLLMTDDVTVSAMPSAIISASTNVTVNPTLSVNYDTGEITASVSKTQSVNVVTEAGYAPVTSHEVVMSGNVATKLITHDSDDLTVSGNTVTAPEGYYPNSASKTVQSGSAATPTLGIEATPNIAISNSGKITSSVSKAESITPVVSEGYVTAGTAGTVTFAGSNTLQLNTKSGATITPTESQQVAVEQNRWTTGQVKVGAISSSYVGSGVTRNDSTNLSVGDATVTAPAGYYENAASATVQSATWKSASTIGVVPSISVDANGLITATASGWTSCKPLSASGYADADTSANLQLSGSKTSQLDTIGATTYTPTKGTAQTIPHGNYLTGDQTISAIPDSWYDMSGANAWLGAGAELVQTFTLSNVKLSATDFNTWTPSTTATDILATRTAGTFTASDMPDYDYYICWETKIPIVYLSGSTNKAKGLYLSAFHVQALVRRASSYANLQAGVLNSNVNLSAFTGGNFYRYYNATQDNLTYTNNTSYGFYGTVTANTFSSSTATSPTVTLKTPKVTARCSTTYLSTGNAAVIDKANTVISQKCTVYKVKAPSFMRGIWNNVMRLVQEVDPA